MQPFRVAATQLDVRLGEVEHNLEGHRRLAAEAAGEGCALVVFPELSATGHSGDPEVTRSAEPHDGTMFQALHAVAREHRLVVGYGFCEAFRGTHYNPYSLVGPDGLLGLQRKVHASYDEFFHFRQAYDWSVVDLGFAKVDLHRALRAGGAEAIFCPGKTPEQVIAIARRLAVEHGNVLATRCAPETAAAAERAGLPCVYHPTARLLVVRPEPREAVGLIVVAAAGTADLPVADEAALVAEALGNRVERVNDCGVAGLHRLLAHRELLAEANVIVAVAGMEGALPSVVAGLVDLPSSPCRPAWATAPPSTGSPPCSPCSTPAPPACRS